MEGWMERMIGVVVGPPCAGKGRCVVPVLERRGFQIVSTRGLLEKHGNPEVMERVRGGDLAADDVMVGLLSKHAPEAERILIDSLRSAQQVRWLNSRWPSARRFTCFLNVGEETVRRRLAAARDTERGVRLDDAAIDRRLEEYRRYSQETLPLLQSSTHFVEIDGEQSPDEVQDEVCRHVANFVHRGLHHYLMLEA
jgi:adenylate kinase family enzyme